MKTSCCSYKVSPANEGFLTGSITLTAEDPYWVEQKAKPISRQERNQQRKEVRKAVRISQLIREHPRGIVYLSTKSGSLLSGRFSVDDTNTLVTVSGQSHPLHMSELDHAFTFDEPELKQNMEPYWPHTLLWFGCGVAVGAGLVWFLENVI